MKQIIINSPSSKDALIAQIESLYAEHGFLRVDIKTSRQRSDKQNRALHKYLSMLACELNERGLDMKKTLKHDVDIPWDGPLAKEYLWRPIQKAMTGKESTTKPDRAEYPKIYDTLNRMTAQKFGISLPWPCDTYPIDHYPEAAQ